MDQTYDQIASGVIDAAGQLSFTLQSFFNPKWVEVVNASYSGSEQLVAATAESLLIMKADWLQDGRSLGIINAERYWTQAGSEAVNPYPTYGGIFRVQNGLQGKTLTITLNTVAGALPTTPTSISFAVHLRFHSQELNSA